MFTLEQIKEAHSRVKSGADFPRYIQELIGLGVAGNSIFVSDGRAEYWDSQGSTVSSGAEYAELAVSPVADKEKFARRLKLHQEGGTDYPTFCRDAAEGGIQHWTLDMGAMSCAYYDRLGNEILVEDVPGK